MGGSGDMGVRWRYMWRSYGAHGGRGAARLAWTRSFSHTPHPQPCSPCAQVATEESIVEAVGYNHPSLRGNAFCHRPATKAGACCVCDLTFLDAKGPQESSGCTRRRSGGGRVCYFCMRAMLTVSGSRAQSCLRDETVLRQVLATSDGLRTAWVARGFVCRRA